MDFDEKRDGEGGVQVIDLPGAFKEARLSGKATAATISDAPALGFCDSNDMDPQYGKKDEMMKSNEEPIEELKESEKTQMAESSKE